MISSNNLNYTCQKCIHSTGKVGNQGDLHIRKKNNLLEGGNGFHSSGLYLYSEIIFGSAAAIMAELLHKGDVNIRLILHT